MRAARRRNKDLIGRRCSAEGGTFFHELEAKFANAEADASVSRASARSDSADASSTARHSR